MSYFLKNISKLHRTCCILSSRGVVYYNKDWKPGPYPKNAEERAAAAKKYGLRPEDYAPYPDDGFAPGDYPYIKPFSLDNRDPWEFYDYYPDRWNYAEPLNIDHEAFREGALDPEDRYTQYFGLSGYYMYFWAFFPLFLLFAGTMLAEYYKAFEPMMVKQFPYTGEKHYEFDELD